MNLGKRGPEPAILEKGTDKIHLCPVSHIYIDVCFSILLTIVSKVVDERGSPGSISHSPYPRRVTTSSLYLNSSGIRRATVKMVKSWRAETGREKIENTEKLP